MAALQNNLHILIMAGGSGTRFWPKSRLKRPKQLLALWDDKTLLEHTVERFRTLVPQENIWICTTESLVEASQQVLKSKHPSVHFLAEPTGKNTAPCILWSLRSIERANPKATVAVMPADHYIGDEKSFLKVVSEAASYAEKANALVTLGIKANRPETGFGYIEFKPSASTALPVIQFVEKPDLRTAVRYIESGKYLWNAGMFIFTLETGLSAFQKCMPELYSSIDGVDARKVYPKIRPQDAISIDYGVMEQAAQHHIPVAVLPLDCKWNDIGSFTALEELGSPTVGEVVSLDATCNIVQSDAGLVALLGVNDLVVVRDGDVVLVASKERAQDIKALLEKVKTKNSDKL